MLNYQLSQKLKLLGNGEFNHLTINLTIYISNQHIECESARQNESGAAANQRVKMSRVRRPWSRTRASQGSIPQMPPPPMMPIP